MLLIVFFMLISCHGKYSIDHVNEIPLDVIGNIQHKHSSEIQSSNWSIGGEALDRKFADYFSYHEYVGKLGVKSIRLQAGWAKTEQERGKYSFDWLIEIVKDATSQDVTPWIQLSYGNPIYPGGGNIGLGSLLPSSEVAINAWEKWVEEIVKHLNEYVTEWEIWNEIDHGRTTPEEYGEFFIKTSDIIKNLQPDAKIYGIASSSLDDVFFRRFLKYLQNKSKLENLTAITYHGYVKRPEEHYQKVDRLQKLANIYSNDLYLIQGENGAPSQDGGFGALTSNGIGWTENKQAKWNLRRMIGDAGRNIPTNIFTIIDLKYPSAWNHKGLLHANEDKTVAGEKVAYTSMQNVTAIFDHHLQLDQQVIYNMRERLPVTGFGFKSASGRLFTLWKDDRVPIEENEYYLINVNIDNIDFKEPVIVDLLTGKVYFISSENWECMNNRCSFKSVPIYDSPILIIERNLVQIR